jgi:hypothetical protein
MNRLIWILIFTGLLILIDFYVFQAVKTVTQSFTASSRKAIYFTYWGFNIATVVGIILLLFIGFENVSSQVRNFFMTWVIAMFLAKTFIVLFLLIDDIIRLVRWIVGLFETKPVEISPNGKKIPRIEFLSKVGLIAATIPIISFTYGIVKGAHNYVIRRQRIGLKNLPESFNGLRIAQLSDIHSGSFFDKEAVKRGVQMVLNEKPDVIFFTGDLVNNLASEMEDYLDVFDKLKAPMGVYSTLGNHDYADYVQWPSKQEKMDNLQTLIGMHKQMGWDILMNEHRILKKGDDQIAILGIENWSAKSNFPKYGKLDKAYAGTEDIPVKLLLSHDPSHWRAQVVRDYKNIDITFSGHTHGFQFGVESWGIKWSPVQWVYKEWAGLYKEANQFLYVNRGFGYLGFPGRIGINPEITIVELYKA